MKILFVASEAFPFIKTGGLADVVGALPLALAKRQHDVKLLIPYYKGMALDGIDCQPVCCLGDPLGFGTMEVMKGRVTSSGGDASIELWLLKCPALYERDGGPYLTPEGIDHVDNHKRFAALSWAGATLTLNGGLLGWQADIVHAHDWQVGLLPAYLSSWKVKHPPVLFTIHNLQYTGVFPRHSYTDLGLSEELYHLHGLEYFGNYSMLKAGIQYSDLVSTVSPTYAKEIQTDEYGCGLQGLLSDQQHKLHGVLNGVDTQIWNPATDTALAATYDKTSLDKKALNKRTLQRHCGLPESNAMLFGVVSRLTQQKGLDLVLEALPPLLSNGVQLVVLGSGDKSLEQKFTALAQQYPDQVSVRIGYDEPYSHLLQAGVDCLLIPSRFEPCGLTQLYALQYGTLPLVRATGGLADSVWECEPDKPQTGFVFQEANVEALGATMRRAVAMHQQPETWRQIQQQAMAQDFDWCTAAAVYESLYLSA